MKKFIFALLFLFLTVRVEAVTTGNVTLKLSGGDYSTWAGFWNDIGSLTGNLTLTVDASAFTEDTAPANITESFNGYTLQVTPASFPTKSDASDGARFTCNYTGQFLPMQMEGAGTLIVEGMVYIEGTSESTEVIELVTIGNPFDFHFRRNIIKGGGVGFYAYDAQPVSLVYNNFIYDCSSSGIFKIKGTGSYAYNNTVVGCGIGIDANSQSIPVFENNICYLNTTDFANIGSATGNNNTSYDATCADANWATGANNRESKTADPFTDIDNDDFTLAAGSDPIENGKDLSGTFTIDFFGDTRDTWDIGADYYAAAAAARSRIIIFD